MVRLSCRKPWPINPAAPDVVARGEKSMIVVGSDKVVYSGKGCSSPGSHSHAIGSSPAACHVAFIKSHALSHRADTKHHSDLLPDITGEQMMGCIVGLNFFHCAGSVYEFVHPKVVPRIDGCW